MKKVLGGLTILLILGLVLAGCAGAIDPNASPEARATYSPTAEDIEKAAPFLSWGYNPDRGNASGDKITSNAHSADFDGIYFFWDSKQKDDGILKVSDKYFDVFDTFVLTVKDASKYLDFTVGVQPDQKMTSDGYWTFNIPRGLFNDKNINMVFLNDWVKNWNFIIGGNSDPDPIESKSIVFEKKVFTEYGNKLVTDIDWTEKPYSDWTFDIMDGDEPIAKGLRINADGKIVCTSELIKDGVEYTIVEHLNGWESKYLEGSLKIESAEMKNITILSRASTNVVELDDMYYMINPEAPVNFKNMWNDNLLAADPVLFNTLMGIEKNGVNAKWVWDGEYKDTLAAYGITGSRATIDTETFTIPNDYELPESAVFYYACDNAAVVFVNGTWVGCTSYAFYGDEYFGKELPTSAIFKTLDNDTFNGDAWQHVYSAQIAGALKHDENKITIYAANSAGTEVWNDTNNPCGLIYACSFDINKTAVSEFHNIKKTFYGANDDEIISGNNGLFVGMRLKIKGGDATVGDRELDVAGYEYYLRLEHLSAGNPQEFGVFNNQDVKIGTAVFEIVNGDLVVTVKLTQGVFNNATNSVHVYFTHDETDTILQNGSNGNWTTHQDGPKAEVAEYTFTIPHNKLAAYIVE